MLIQLKIMAVCIVARTPDETPNCVCVCSKHNKCGPLSLGWEKKKERRYDQGTIIDCRPPGLWDTADQPLIEKDVNSSVRATTSN